MTTYSNADDWVELSSISKGLAGLTATGKDCLSALCTLSNEGTWQTSKDGVPVYNAPVDAGERVQRTETGTLPVETYTPGDFSIPTRIARKLGLGEYVVCNNAGYILQGDTIMERPVHQAKTKGIEKEFLPTTLRRMLQEESEEDVYWTPLKWRHIQSLVDETGGQSCRFELLAAILDRLAVARMESETFIPYGHQFADSDFVDSI